MSIKKLKTVLFVTEITEKAAEVAFLGAQRQLLDQESKLGQLQKYKNDYTRLAETYAGLNTGAVNLKIARKFLEQLDELVGQQESSLEAHANELDRRQSAWLDCRARRKAIDGLVSRRVVETEQHEVKVAQRQLDDLFLHQRM